MQTKQVKTLKTSATTDTTRQTRVNETAFAHDDTVAVDFFNRNGWVVLKQPLARERFVGVEKSWRAMVDAHAADFAVPTERYLAVISQWRDLWKVDAQFAETLRDIAPLAATMLELGGARLFHDHIICKAANSANGEVPWHQDSMYWPVDRTGLSTWMAVQDVPAAHGCLEVADGSHMWGASEPIDFMLDEACLPRTARTSLLPVEAGDMIILHSRTWHRSAPTQMLENQRIAHISLWLPRETRYWPDNADWHPTNAQVSVRKGELLNEDEFPVFGASDNGYGNTLENKNPAVTRSGGMFGSTNRIQKQMQKVLGTRKPVLERLHDADFRTTLTDKISMRSAYRRDDIADIIERLWISVDSFRKNGSRNVFCAVYTEWSELYGGLGSAN